MVAQAWGGWGTDPQAQEGALSSDWGGPVYTHMCQNAANSTSNRGAFYCMYIIP